MIKKTITYTDYNDVEITEDFYFNLSKPELIELEFDTIGGMKDLIVKVINTKDSKQLVSIFKKLVLAAYGEKSQDGKRFVKSDEISTAFSQTPAYEILFMELAQDADKATEFITGVMPKDLADEAKKNPVDIPGLKQ